MPVLFPSIEQSFSDTGIVLTSGLLLILVVAVRNLIERERLAEVESVNQELRSLQSSLEQRVSIATRDLGLAAEVGRRLSLVRDTDVMLTDAVEMIGERFDLYYTQVYLTDPTGRALILRAGTGEVGQILLRRGHRLPVDMSSLNGITATERRAVIVEDTETSSVHRPNPLLPDTRSEMVVPLLVGERVVGVLDMQSVQPGAFSEENLPAFEALAGQLAISIANAELFEETERARTVVEEQTRRLTSEGWQDFMDAIERSERIAYTFDRENITPFEAPLLGAIDDSTLVAPIQISGEQVGTFQFERETGWTINDQTIANTVAQQVAQQIENLRLLAQSEQYQAEAQEALQRLTREGWGQYQAQFKDNQIGFIYSDFEVKALDETEIEPEIAVTVPITVRNESVGQLEVWDTKTLTEEDAEIVAYVNEQLSTHLENLRLTQQTQNTLAQTEMLYEGSEKVVRATSMKDVLRALVETTALKQLDRNSLNIFDHPWDSENPPEGMTMVASQVDSEEGTTVPEGTYYRFDEYPAARFIASNEPNFFVDLSQDSRFDEHSRQYFTEVLKAKGVITLPLVIGGRSIGGFVALTDKPLEINEDEIRQITSLADQAASTIQNMRLYEQTQKRAQREQALRQITEAVRGSTDPATIMRTAVQELGTALGRRTQIRFEQTTETLDKDHETS